MRLPGSAGDEDDLQLFYLGEINALCGDLGLGHGSGALLDPLHQVAELGVAGADPGARAEAPVAPGGRALVAAEVLWGEALGVEERLRLPARRRGRGLLRGVEGPVQLVVRGLPVLLELSDRLSLSRLRVLQPHDLRHQALDHGVQGPQSLHGFCRHGAIRES